MRSTMLSARQQLPEPSVLDQIAANPMFGALPRAVLADLMAHSSQRAYRKGHHLFEAGDPSAYVVFVKSGLVALTGLDVRGNLATVLTFSSGAIFAQVPAILGCPHPWTGTAVVDTEVILIPKDVFIQTYRRSPEMALHLIRSLSEMLHRSQETAVRLTLAPANSRVAGFLLESASKAADKASEQLDFDLGLSHRDLALLLGTARETVTRVLTGFARAGVIAITGHRISILRPDALRSIAEGERTEIKVFPPVGYLSHFGDQGHIRAVTAVLPES